GTALHQGRGLLFGNYHHRGWRAGDNGGRALLPVEKRHGAEDRVRLYIADLDAAHEGFGVSFGNDEHMIRLVPLTDQLGAGGEVLEAGDRTDFGRLAARQGI